LATAVAKRNLAQYYKGATVVTNPSGRRKVLESSNPIVPLMAMPSIRHIWYGQNYRAAAPFVKDWIAGYDLVQSGYAGSYTTSINGFSPITYTPGAANTYYYYSSGNNLVCNNYFVAGGWFYTPTQAGVVPLMRNGDSTEQWVLYNNSNNLSFECYNASGQAKYGSTVSCPAGWHFVAVQYSWVSAGTFTLKLYVDGVWGNNAADPGAALRNAVGSFVVFKHGTTYAPSTARMSLAFLAGVDAVGVGDIDRVFEETRQYYGV
jgi:hypothetical protein